MKTRGPDRTGVPIAPREVGERPTGAESTRARAKPRASDRYERTAARRRVSTVASGAANPTRLVRIQGTAWDVLLPGLPGDASTAFATYTRKLLESDCFRDQTAEVTALTKLGCEASPPVADDAPCIAILVSEPRLLVPGNNANFAKLVEAIRAMGGRPVLIPPRADLLMPADRKGRAQAIAALIAQMDGVVGPGGADIDPKLYHELSTHTVNPNLGRDWFEAELLKQALTGETFVFGICRSHQLINAVMPGPKGAPRARLAQDVRAAGLATTTQNQKELGIPGDQPMVFRNAAGLPLALHVVQFSPRSRMAATLGERRDVATNSFHHQAVLEPGPGLEVVGTVYDPTTGKRTIEATEGWNVFTTQFHPEAELNEPWAQKLFGTVVRRARIFKLVKALEAAGEAPAAAPILAAMRQAPGGTYEPSDFAWVERDLAPHLGR